MRILYLECNAGASGDMLLGSLSELLDDRNEFVSMMGSIGIPGIEVRIENGERSHIHGTKVRILVHGHEEDGSMDHHHHEHRTLEEVLRIIDDLNISDKVKTDAKSIYSAIAGAESKAHGEPVGEIHFHEVGMLDAIADIVGTCMLIERLNPDVIVSSELRTGHGYIDCAHGKLPIPAPATANLLMGIPSYAGDLEGEFTTPTGAALIGHFAKDFGNRPRMNIQKIGIGLGYHDREIPNILRAFIGESERGIYEIYELNCNIDDMTPEDIAPVIDRLLEEGALDATLSAMIMKKGRPGYRLTCLCREKDKERIARTILMNTSTIGLRMWKAERFEMASRTEVCSTEYGDVRVKVSEGYGIRKWKPEHDDLVRISEEKEIPISKIRDSVKFE